VTFKARLSGHSTGSYASGWNVYRNELAGRWQWSAYGPNGGTHGEARTESMAREKAQQAERDLRHPLRTEA
jgi:hypothetical protein